MRIFQKPSAKRTGDRSVARHPALVLVRVVGGGLLILALLAGFFTWRDSRTLVKAAVRANLRLEGRMLSGFLADEGRQLRIATAMTRHGHGRLLHRYLVAEAARIPAFALYDARGRREAVWGSTPEFAPPRLPVARLRRSPRFRNDRLLPTGTGPRSAFLLARRDRDGGWAVFVMKRALLDRLLFTPVELPGNRLALHTGPVVLVQRERELHTVLRGKTVARFLGNRPLVLSVPLAARRTNLVLTARVPAAALMALWWRRNLVAVVLVAVLLQALVLLERAVRASLARERALQEEKEQAAIRHVGELEQRVRAEQRLKNIKEVHRLLNDAVARHLPERMLFRHAVEILEQSRLGAGFWFAVYNGEDLGDAADVTTASGWSLFVGPGVDPARLSALYAPRPGLPDQEPTQGRYDPIQQLIESGEEVCLTRLAERTDLDPRWPPLLESRHPSGLFLCPILRDPLLVGQFGFFVGPDDGMDENQSELEEFAREVARTLSYGLTDLAARQALEYAGLHDLLTAVPNRRLFYDRLQQLLRSLERDNTPFAVAILDLDGFKAINDAHGHLAGDRVLVALASRLHESLRTYDTVARLGGDEFALLLPRLSSEAVPAFLQRLREFVVRPFVLGAGSLDVRPSLGLACAPRDGNERDTLMRAADSALYRAKNVGGGAWLIYDEERDAHVLRPLPPPRPSPAPPPVACLEPEVDASRGTITGLVLQYYDRPAGRPITPYRAGEGDDDHRRALGMLADLRPVTAAPPPLSGLTLSVPFPVVSLTDEHRMGEVFSSLAPFVSHGWRPLVVLSGDDPEMMPWIRLGIRRLRREGVAVGWQFDPDHRYRPDELARFEIDRAVLAPDLVDNLPRRLWPSAIAASFLAAADLLDLTVLARGVKKTETAEVLTQLGCRRLAGPWVGPSFEPEKASGTLRVLARDRWNGRTVLPHSLGGFGDLPLLLYRGIHEPWLDRGYVRLYLRRRGKPPPPSECSLGAWITRRATGVSSPATRASLHRLALVHNAFHAALRSEIEEEGGELYRYDPAAFRALWPEFEEAVAAVRADLSASPTAGLG